MDTPFLKSDLTNKMGQMRISIIEPLSVVLSLKFNSKQ